MNHDAYPDSYIRAVLDNVKTVAIVGASANPSRPSYLVVKYLSRRGYRVFPVNPGLAGQTLLDLPVFGALADIPEPVDMVDIFRASEHVGPVVDAALAMRPPPKVIWMQLGIRNDEVATKAEAAGLQVVMNRCPKIEYGRLSSEIGWMGVNSRTISAKKPIISGSGVQRLGLRNESEGS